jgi:hypothetical protein
LEIIRQLESLVEAGRLSPDHAKLLEFLGEQYQSTSTIDTPLSLSTTTPIEATRVRTEALVAPTKPPQAIDSSRAPLELINDHNVPLTLELLIE